tara:strand:- start:473 stop:601 length:129 start_codon:yes stop_codon:yes gene_type:complete
MVLMKLNIGFCQVAMFFVWGMIGRFWYAEDIINVVIIFNWDF